MVDKNLFLYNLAVAAIFKNEARYLKEWLDYHLLAGVEHFYLYNNDSSDDFREILAPYVNENLVTLTDFPGKIMQYPAYDDALENFRFECRYMAFIDLDEFILPKSNRSVVEVVDEIFSRNEKAAGLGINWQCFGSNGHVNADYSRGVLERFTQRAPTDWLPKIGGNTHVKTIANPRATDYFPNPHFAYYFNGRHCVNENGGVVQGPFNNPVTAEKIVLNHYHTKSREEYRLKHSRGRADILAEKDYGEEKFSHYDHNEIFDDSILKYRDVRAKNFSFESDNDRISRVINSLVRTLTQSRGNLETLLTCRAVAEKFDVKIGGHSAEEFALAQIHRSLTCDALTYADLQLFIEALPQILTRPFPLAKKISQTFAQKNLPTLLNVLKNSLAWREYKNLRGLQRFLESIQ